MDNMANMKIESNMKSGNEILKLRWANKNNPKFEEPKVYLSHPSLSFFFGRGAFTKDDVMHLCQR